MKVVSILIPCAVGILAALWAGLCVSWWLALVIVILPLIVLVSCACTLLWLLGIAAHPIVDGHSMWNANPASGVKI